MPATTSSSDAAHAASKLQNTNNDVHQNHENTEIDPDFTSSSGESSNPQADDTSSEEIVSNSGSEGDAIASRIEDPDKEETTDLRSRLLTFLPQLQKANAELVNDSEASTKQIEDVDSDEEQYIEMNLGLGVLSEHADEEDVKFEKDSSPEDIPEEESGDDPVNTVGQGDSSIMAKLKGEPMRSAKRRKIEEVD